MTFLKWLRFIILLIYFQSAAPIKEKQSVEYRLRQDVIVLGYDIKLFLKKDIFKTNVFTGNVKINFTMVRPTKELKLHANGIDFTNVLIKFSERQEILNKHFKSDPVTDILTIKTKDYFSSGSTYTLEMKYKGKLRTDELQGFYKSSYTTPNGTQVFLATTQFEPISARKAFPCLDEPNYKAVFKIEIRHPSRYTAVANTAGTPKLDEQDNSYTITTFERTPKMPTYLVAFVVSDFTCDEEAIDEVTKHFVCSRNETAPIREIAAKTGPKLIKVMEEWTGIKYSELGITKMHHFAIPDFQYSAMENWGLITYKETGLLWDKNESSNYYLQKLKTVIAHEIAHMWFGNLVTMYWWSDTFLNEAFARYFQYHGTAKIVPDWELDKQFVVECLHDVLARDSSATSQALSCPVSSPAEINTRFGAISYNKGTTNCYAGERDRERAPCNQLKSQLHHAINLRVSLRLSLLYTNIYNMQPSIHICASILRMINHFMDAINFQTGVREYLRDNKYGHAEPKRLWNALQKTAKGLPPNISLAQVVENWIVKPGYPVLKVEPVENNVSISQKRFLISGNLSSDDKWYVPISYTTSQDPNNFEKTSLKAWLLPSNDLVLNNVLIGKNAWIILNNLQTGYYRIEYEGTLWTNIKTALLQSEFSGIHEINRAQIIDDYYSFAKAGIYSYSEFLNLIKFLKNDTSYYSWHSAFSAFSDMLSNIGNKTIYQHLSQYVLDTMGTLYSSALFNVSNEKDQIYSLKQELVIKWACKLGLKDCVNNAVAVFKFYKNSKKRPDKNLRSVVYCTGLMHSTEPIKDWKYVWNDLKTMRLATEQNVLLSALGCAKNEYVLNKFFSYSIDPKLKVKNINIFSAFFYVYSRNPERVDICLKFLLTHYKKISQYYGSMNEVSALLNNLANRFTRKDQIHKLNTFLNIAAKLPKSFVTSARATLSNALVKLKKTEKLEKELSCYFGLGEMKITPYTINTTDILKNIPTTTKAPKKYKNLGTSLEPGILTLITILFTLRRLCYHKMELSKWLRFIILLTYSQFVVPIEQKQTVKYRLPKDVDVFSYDIKLFLQKDIFETNVFTGNVTINFTMVRPTNELKLHANGINITNVSISTMTFKQQEVVNKDFKSDPVTDIFTIITKDYLLKESTYKLEITYEGKLRTDEHLGFYKSSYTTPNGTQVFLATTQFEPVSARKAFPCFDEPNYKAVFKMEIRHSSRYTAVANTVGTSKVDEQDNSYTMTTFEQTPKMSTYLIAFVVSDFTCDEESIDGVTKHFVCSKNETAPIREIAAKTGPKIIKVMEEWTGIKYSELGITKMHHFAIPDFQYDAMENWGLVTYKETGLLWDKDESPNSYLQDLKLVIAHEVAHMWFGNFVTMHWWSDTFLNEAFARYFQYHGTAEIEPTWELDKQFVVECLHKVLASDSSATSKALSSPVSSPAEILTRFGGISYNKGASIVRMVLHFMGVTNFQTGVRKYLKTNKYGNTKPKNLWTALQETANGLPPNISLTQVVENWIINPGYPVLTVKIKGHIIITISQKRFITSRNLSSDGKWYVPISYTTSLDASNFKNTTVKEWLLPSNDLVLTNVTNSTNAWIILNNQQTGYYRIRYEGTLWTNIITALSLREFDGIHEINRAQIIDDYYNFAKAGIHSYSEFLNLIKFLKNDTSYYSWHSAFSAFSDMLSNIGNKTIYHHLSQYILNTMSSLYSSALFNVSNETDQMYSRRQELVTKWACKLDLKDCVDNAVVVFKSYKNSKKRPDKNLRSVVYCTGLMHSNEPMNDWKYVWNDLKTMRLATEQDILSSALGCAKNKDVLNKLFRYSINPKLKVKNINIFSAFFYVYSRNPEKVDICLKFLLTDYKKISQYYGSIYWVSSLLSNVVNKFTRKDQIDKLNTFLNTVGNLPKSFVTSARETLSKALTKLKKTEKLEKELSFYFGLGGILKKVPTFKTTKTPKKYKSLGTSLRPGIFTLITILFSLVHFVLIILESIMDVKQLIFFLTATSLCNALQINRLDKSVVPINYNIHLAFNSTFVETNVFAGKIEIRINVSSTIDVIRIHARNLNLTSCKVDGNNISISNISISTNNSGEILQINLPTPLDQNEYNLTLTYYGNVNIYDLQALYKSSYKNGNQTEYFVVTHLHPMHARRLFPCFDEPDFKATFELTVTYPRGYTVLSNTSPKKKNTISNDSILETIEFEISPKMSTYLFALVISKLTCTYSQSDGILYNVCSRPGTESLRQYALIIAPKAVKYMEKFTGISYNFSTIKKLDLVAVPDLEVGAMENWGLITFKETALLWDMYQPSNYRQKVASTVVHEIAHMWFGNLVTMKWWSDAFLNEGFARYFQYFATAEIEKNWELDKQFVIEQVQSALMADSRNSSLPLSSEVTTFGAVAAKFDVITYNKGASIIRMVESIIGTKNFKQGLQDYLQENKLGSTTPNHLWSCLEKHVNLSYSLSERIKNWTIQAGFPLLEVTNNNTNIIITQQRFVPSGANFTTKWYVPITYSTSRSTNQQNWLTPGKDLVLNVSLSKDADWIIINSSQIGFYRVYYDDDLWKRIEVALKKNLNATDVLIRAQIVDDLFSFAMAGNISYVKLLNRLSFLKSETEFYPWYSAFRGFESILWKINDQEIKEKLINHILELMMKLYESVPILAVDNKNQMYALKQSLALNWACNLGHSKCLRNVEQLFNAYHIKGVSVRPNLRFTTYCTRLRRDKSLDVWDFLWNKLINGNKVASEREIILKALGCSNNENRLEKYIAAASDVNSEIPRQYTSLVFNSIIKNSPVGFNVTLKFLTNNYTKISKYHKDETIESIVQTLTNQITKRTQIEELYDFAKNKNLTMSIETAEVNLHLSNKIEADLKQYFSSGGKSNRTILLFVILFVMFCFSNQYLLSVYGKMLLQVFGFGILLASSGALPAPVHDVLGHKIREYGSEYRLPTNVEPTHYTLNLKLEEDFTTNKNFSGSVEITIIITSSVNIKSIDLHAKYLEIDTNSIELYENSSQKKNIFDSIEGPDEETDIVTIKSSADLVSGTTYILKIGYTGKLSDTEMTGFYLSSYKISGKDKYLATTQFENTGARRAFPCFDEPALKAEFEISITYPDGYRAISNTPIQTKTSGTAKFTKTPFMSTYLVAFVIISSDFDCTEIQNIDNFTTQVCSRPGTKGTATLAATVPNEVVPVMKDYTKVNAIKTGQLIQFAVPDMDPGAMENWGLLIYREAYLLSDDKESSVYEKQHTVTVAAHEISHQWFGDLITLDWWSDTFLNEGFATYFEYYAPDINHPDWELPKQFVIEQLQTALVTDSKDTSLPLSWDSDDVIDNRFDDISYNKGGSILRMVHHFLKLENFKSGLSTYISNAGRTGTPDILWKSLNPRSDNTSQKLLPEGMTIIMNSWTKKTGYPLLTVSKTSDNSVTISQEAFVLSDKTVDTKWYVPITYTLSNSINDFINTETKEWLTPEEPLTLKSVLNNSSWIILNNQQVGYYRVDYDDDLWKEITDTLESNITNIDEISRAQIVDDLLNMARAGKKDYGKVLTQIKFLQNDISYYSWYAALANFDYLLPKVDDDLSNSLNEYLSTLIKKFVDSVPIDKLNATEHIYTLKQVLALKWACRLNISDCVSKTQKLFEDFKKDSTNKKPDPNLRSVVYCTALKHSNNASEDFEFLKNEFNSAELASEKVTILKSLGCVNDASIRKNYLMRALTDEIRRQDAKYAFSSVYSTGNEGVDDILDFITEKHADFNQRFGSTSTLSSLISGLADFINTDDQIKKLSAFKDTENLEPDYKTAAEAVITIGNNNIKENEKLKKQLKKYFSDDDDDNSASVAQVANIALVLMGYLLFNFF
ncbi:uncharacterized protein LOC123007677 [Tribolium madens]|uniref:uncharacterized protein LOC123007677 n=1 Tax=Tribolium madens TaxID=41895 RepID=UPI001CF759FA|nr:uncharacterized protein LOC123007677 [Tribolium madens]